MPSKSDIEVEPSVSTDNYNKQLKCELELVTHSVEKENELECELQIDKPTVANDDPGDHNKQHENTSVNGNEDSCELDDRYSSKTTVIYDIPSVKPKCDVVKTKQKKRKKRKEKQQKNNGKKACLLIKIFDLKGKGNAKYKVKCKLCGEISKLQSCKSAYRNFTKDITLVAMCVKKLLKKMLYINIEEGTLRKNYLF